MRFCVLSIMALVCTVLSFNMYADDTGSTPSRQENVVSESDGKWIVNHADSRRIYAVQCGLDVTLFALKYFKIDYSLPRVSLGLPFTMEGISLADIQHML